MSPSHRPSPFGSPPTGGQESRPPRHQEETLKVEKIYIERKTFVLALKQNPRGQFLRITEDVAGRRDTIIIPSTGLEEFRRAIDEMVKIVANQPSQSP